MAYYFHWDYETVMQMDHMTRRRFCAEISETIRRSAESRKIFLNCRAGGTKAVAENGENRRRSYNFIVYLEGKRIGFERLSGLSEEENFEVLREGGWNRAVYALVSGGGRQERSLTLERGVLEREMEFRLYQPGYRSGKRWPSMWQTRRVR